MGKSVEAATECPGSLPGRYCEGPESASNLCKHSGFWSA